jgi:RNA polymerase sigma factor (sigma-70 family)
MFEINRDNVFNLLELCHPALMKAWNKYRQQMYARGFETADAKNEVAVKVLDKRDTFRGSTQAQFCAWSKQILVRWILAELRRKRPGQIDSGHDTADSGQERPSQAFQDELRYAVYLLARAKLPEHERNLIELRYEQDLSVRKVGEALRKDYPLLWQIHQAEWDSEAKLGQGCEKAKQHFNEMAAEVHRQLEGGSPDESDPT